MKNKKLAQLTFILLFAMGQKYIDSLEIYR